MNLQAKISGNGSDDSNQELIEILFVMSVSGLVRNSYIHFEFLTQDAAGGVIEYQLSCPVSNSFHEQRIKQGMYFMVISTFDVALLLIYIHNGNLLTYALFWVFTSTFLKFYENNWITWEQINVIPTYGS